MLVYKECDLFSAPGILVVTSMRAHIIVLPLLDLGGQSVLATGYALADEDSRRSIGLLARDD